jgi:hypothetical protein
MLVAGYPTLLTAQPILGPCGPIKSRGLTVESDIISHLSTEPGSIEIEIDIDGSTSDGSVAVDRTLSLSSDSEGVAMKLPEAETLIIFDWDDTIFPTTWLLNEGLLDSDTTIDLVQSALLQTLEEHAARTLQTAMQYGKVVIITNAIQDWVEQSCGMFMPSLLPFIQHFEIVSARSTYESKDAPSPTSWKKLAFAREVEGFCGSASRGARTIISLGDSLCEQQALVAAVGTYANCSAKSLKFMEQPHIQQLLDQHELVCGCFAGVYEHEGNLDLEVGTVS